jgi:DNA-binding MarR family transcriptional regulator
MTDSPRPDGPAAAPRISYAIARLQQLILTAVTEEVAPFGLTALQFTTLSVLGRHGAPLSNSQLARRSFMTPQSMHEVIHRLEKEGLIKRVPHPEHRRKLPASLTAKGRRVLAACEEAVTTFESRMLRGFAAADRHAFLQMIAAAVRNLDGGFMDLAKGKAGAATDERTAGAHGLAPAPRGRKSARARAASEPLG